MPPIYGIKVQYVQEDLIKPLTSAQFKAVKRIVGKFFIMLDQLIIPYTTALGVLTGKFRQKRSKSINIRFWWLKDQIDQRQFNAEWGPGKENLTDYTTKFYIPAYRKRIQPIQLFIKDRLHSTL